MEQPATESRASSWGLMMSRARPVRAVTSARNAGPFSAERHACVAMARTRIGERRRILSAQTPRAAGFSEGDLDQMFKVDPERVLWLG